jgi:hypothetical protein
MMIGEGGRITGVLPFEENTQGNPYLVFGQLVKSEFGLDPLECTIVVATVSSGSLDMLLV